MRLHRLTCAAALILLLGATLPCAAQITPAPDTPPPQRDQRDQNACSNEQRSGDGQTLSKKLEQTEGVICPPEIDSNIKAPTPQGGKMPIIPPPGSPGGDPTVRPK